MELELSDESVYSNMEKIQKLNGHYTKSKHKLEQMNERWEKLITEITALQKD